MIVQMKKAYVLCIAERRDEALEALREIGVVHVTNVKAPEGKELDEARGRAEAFAQAQAALRAALVEAGGRAPSAAAEPAPQAPTLVADILDLADAREKAKEKLREIEVELTRIAPLGEFEPESIRRLAAQGIRVDLYRALKTENPETPEGTVRTDLGSDGDRRFFAIAGPEAAFGPEPLAELVALPAHAPAELRRMREECQAQMEADARRLVAFSAHAGALERARAEVEEAARFLEVRHGMGDEGHVAYLQGFCPEPKTEALNQAAAERVWAVILEDHDPEEHVPTLIEYPAWVKPIKAAFDALDILPGYHEADISAVFLLFFTLFYAMLIGDAGYGALFLGVTLLAQATMKKAPRYPFTLMTILNGTTIVWGVLTGNYFGIDAPAPLKALKIEWLTDRTNIMAFSFLIGVVHLSIAHVWNVIVMLPRDTRGYAQVGWLMMAWTMYFASRSMVLGYAFPSFVYGLMGGGLLLIVLFMTPVRELKRDWILHVMLPLNVVSCLVDLISYVRLFAVGMASLAVAQSFNEMALRIGFGDALSGLFAALVLLFGHTLNILLCGLAVLVHGVRLNTLEFSSHKEMTWSGFAYKPFRKSETP